MSALYFCSMQTQVKTLLQSSVFLKLTPNYIDSVIRVTYKFPLWLCVYSVELSTDSERGKKNTLMIVPLHYSDESQFLYSS